MVTFAERIKELRKDRKFTHKQLADLLGTSESAVSMWETGQRSPTKDRMYQIAELFDVSFDYLTGKTETKNYAKEQAMRLSAYSKYLTLVADSNQQKGSPLPEELVVAYAYSDAPQHIKNAIKSLLQIGDDN